MYITDKELTLLMFSNGVVLAMYAKKWEEEGVCGCCSAVQGRQQLMHW